jgi:Flp pilus assembly protein protease CpaA
VQLTLFLLSTYISLFDWKYHRITNSSLLISFVVLTSVSRFTDSELHIMGSMFILLIALIGYKYGLGAGDVKLIALLSTFFLPNTSAGLVDLVGGFAVASLILISIHRLQGRSLADPIALAPAISAAFIWCAR